MNKLEVSNLPAKRARRRERKKNNNKRRRRKSYYYSYPNGILIDREEREREKRNGKRREDKWKKPTAKQHHGGSVMENKNTQDKLFESMKQEHGRLSRAGKKWGNAEESTCRHSPHRHFYHHQVFSALLSPLLLLLALASTRRRPEYFTISRRPRQSDKSPVVIILSHVSLPVG